MKIGKFDITNWSYAGNKLNNPVVIMWKLFWFVPFKLCVAVTCIVAFLGFGKYAATSIWRECR